MWVYSNAKLIIWKLCWGLKAHEINGRVTVTAWELDFSCMLYCFVTSSLLISIREQSVQALYQIYIPHPLIPTASTSHLLLAPAEHHCPGNKMRVFPWLVTINENTEGEWERERCWEGEMEREVQREGERERVKDTTGLQWLSARPLWCAAAFSFNNF